MSKNHGVVIVGGGLVGASLAIALDRLGLDVGLVEATPGGALPAVFDQRNLSFAAATINALSALGVMPRLYTSSLRDPELAVVPLLKPRVERRVVLAYLPGPMRNVVAQELIAFLRERLPQAGEATVRRVSGKGVRTRR